ncbi:MAG: TonB-dependent receptor [Chlorobium sp.]|uniref:TonB-dependent receptor plug domain-containing protein n=1 Tax=Chlorobium sp. TaxID=1095 RepID=UPI002F3F3F74
MSHKQKLCKKTCRALMVLALAGFAGEAQAETGTQTAILDKIVVSATKTPHTLGDVPVDAEVITREELLKRNVQTAQDALDLTSGLSLKAKAGSWGNKGNVRIFGFDAKYTLVLVDGQRLLGGHQNAVDLQQISVEMIERIEILKGPGSALYGSDAVGGVVNIITRKGADKPEFSGSLAMGSRGTVVGSVSGGAGSENLKTRFNYTYRESDGINEDIDSYNEHILQGTVSLNVSDNVGFSLKPYYSFQDMEDQMVNQERYGLNALMNWVPDELSSLKLRGSFYEFGKWDDGSSEKTVLDNYEVELLYSRLVFDSHLVTAGYEFWNERRDFFASPGNNLKMDQTLHSIYLQDEIDWSPVVLVLGGRIDSHEKWGDEINPKASIMLKATDELKIRASIGRAFKAPSLLSLYDEWMMGSITVHPNPDLKPEKSIGYQAGVEYAFARDIIGKVTWFRNDVEDMIHSYVESVPVPGSRPQLHMYYVNIDEAMTQGVELNLDARFSECVSARVGYTWLDTEDKLTGKDLAFSPESKFVSGLDFAFCPADLSLGLEASYIGEHYDADETMLEGFWVCNATLTKKFSDQTEAFIRIDNVFGEERITSEYDLDGTEFLAGLRVKI